MTAEEEVMDLRQEKSLLQEQLAQRDELIAHMQHELVLLREQVQALQEQLNKDSHNSHMPPSSDRFHRQPRSLRKSSGKKVGGQTGHPGSTLMLSPTPDQVVVHVVNSCQHCQRDLCEVESLAVERRQVLDRPPKRVVVIEHQAEAKCCPRCQQIKAALRRVEVLHQDETGLYVAGQRHWMHESRDRALDPTQRCIPSEAKRHWTLSASWRTFTG